MLRNKYLQYATLCLIGTVVFLIYNRFVKYFDFLIVFFLLYLNSGKKFKDFIFYIFIGGLLFDYLYPSYFGVGFFIFYIIFIFKSFYDKFFTNEKSHSYLPFITTSILFYKFLLVFLVMKAEDTEITKFLISSAVDLITYYLINFYLVRQEVVISKA
ncbi:MAG: hypothetical protein JG762_738 [Deferribacteraceae bacterium]|jgi:cell shape-determining protein MreD|nr:hypothetical protein [Deferribacteraceae bacterium]